MKFRLSKVEEGVPFVDIPLGHIAKGVVNNRRVLRAVDHGVLFPSLRCDSVGSFEGKYIDLGPIDAEHAKPKAVPFEEIPVGHVGEDADGNSYLRMEDGGVSLSEAYKGFIGLINFRGNLYEDLGKLVVEKD